jgi:hypothetical protein
MTLKEDDRRRVSQSRVLRRIFRTRKEEWTGGSRKLHNVELNNMHSSPNRNIQIKKDEMGKACSQHGKGEECVEELGRNTRRIDTTREF